MMDLLGMLKTLLVGNMNDIVGPAPEAQARLQQIQAQRALAKGGSLMGTGEGSRGQVLQDLANQTKPQGAGFGVGQGRP